MGTIEGISSSVPPSPFFTSLIFRSPEAARRNAHNLSCRRSEDSGLGVEVVKCLARLATRRERQRPP